MDKMKKSKKMSKNVGFRSSDIKSRNLSDEYYHDMSILASLLIFTFLVVFAFCIRKFFLRSKFDREGVQVELLANADRARSRQNSGSSQRSTCIEVTPTLERRSTHYQFTDADGRKIESDKTVVTSRVSTEYDSRQNSSEAIPAEYSPPPPPPQPPQHVSPSKNERLI